MPLVPSSVLVPNVVIAVTCSLFFAGDGAEGEASNAWPLQGATLAKQFRVDLNSACPAEVLKDLRGFEALEFLETREQVDENTVTLVKTCKSRNQSTRKENNRQVRGFRASVCVCGQRV